MHFFGVIHFASTYDYFENAALCAVFRYNNAIVVCTLRKALSADVCLYIRRKKLNAVPIFQYGFCLSLQLQGIGSSNICSQSYKGFCKASAALTLWQQ